MNTLPLTSLLIPVKTLGTAGSTVFVLALEMNRLVGLNPRNVFKLQFAFNTRIEFEFRRIAADRHPLVYILTKPSKYDQQHTKKNKVTELSTKHSFSIYQHITTILTFKKYKGKRSISRSNYLHTHTLHFKSLSPT